MTVLMLGGSGQAGSTTAEVLRGWYPELSLTIAGRDLARARQVAGRLGAATAVTVDLTREDLGLQAGEQYLAVVATVWDKHLNGLRFAQAHRIPYLSISSGMVDIAPEVMAAGRQDATGPVLVASHWAAGVVTLLAMESARDFGRVDAVRVGSVLDEKDAGGPASAEDLDRWAEAAPAGYVRRDGVFRWVADTAAEVRGPDGVALPGQLAGILDVPSIALATGARDVSFAFAMGESYGRRQGGEPSLDIRIELAGVDAAGAPLTRTRDLVHPRGQRPVTAVGIGLGIERLLGLVGEPAGPGVHSPEGLIDSGHAVERLLGSGAVFVTP